MLQWPAITEPELRERLASDEQQFAAFLRRFFAALGSRSYEPALLERALGYPWARPSRSYLLRNDRVDLLDDLDPGAREATLADFTRERHPLLAFGSNAAPGTLTAKFAHFPAQRDRSVLVVAGNLYGFDVGASASPTAYGVMPATLFASPGTSVRVAILWVTDAQATQLTWSEISYRFGRLDGVRFTDNREFAEELTSVFAFVSRFGAFCVDGNPVALAAVPAAKRSAVALTQRELLDAAARLILGPQAGAEELVRAIFEDMESVALRASETVWHSAQPFTSTRWTPFPGDARSA